MQQRRTVIEIVRISHIVSLSSYHVILFLQLLTFFCAVHTRADKQFKNIVSDKTLHSFTCSIFPSFVSLEVCYFSEASHFIFLLITFAWFRVWAKLRANSFPVQALQETAGQFFTDTLSNVWWMELKVFHLEKERSWRDSHRCGNKAKRYRKLSVEMQSEGMKSIYVLVGSWKKLN